MPSDPMPCPASAAARLRSVPGDSARGRDPQIDAKKYELMHGINGRGTFWTSKLALPHLLKGTNPHVLNLSPPLDLDPR